MNRWTDEWIVGARVGKMLWACMRKREVCISIYESCSLKKGQGWLAQNTLGMSLLNLLFICLLVCMCVPPCSLAKSVATLFERSTSTSTV